MNKLPFEKPQKRKKDHKLMKRIHSENEYMQCDACKGMFKEYNIHHKVRRSQGGDDDLSNFAFLCKKHDSMLHSSPSQFRSIFGSDLYFELLPSLKRKEWIKSRSINERSPSMKSKLILIIIFLMSLSFASVVSIEQDVANHAFLGAAITKVVNEFSENPEETFWIMSALFIGKELADLDKTGFSINDLVYDYVGFALIMWEFEF